MGATCQYIVDLMKHLNGEIWQVYQKCKQFLLNMYICRANLCNRIKCVCMLLQLVL